MTMIPYGRQDVNDADVQAVIDVLRSDFLTQGPVVPLFEQAVAQYCATGYAVSVNSATSALHLACLALGVEQGDIVWTSPITFVASANCARYCGAEVDFVDIDPLTFNISIDALTEKLREAEKAQRLPKVVIPVHLCGQACDMASIHRLSQRYGFKIIEDASHAIGGRYANSPIGNCQFSDITIFSFHPVKIITTGEGGMALTNQLQLAENMQLLRSHGITRDAKAMTHEPDGAWYYQQIALGFNYRITDIQAALGLSQLQRLDELVAKRQSIANRYDQMLVNLPLRVPHRHADCYSSFHLYVILLDTDAISLTHQQIFNGLREAGIGVNLHYIPVHTQPYYQQQGFKTGDFPVAEWYYKKAISLPIFPTLTLEQQDFVIDTLKALLQAPV